MDFANLKAVLVITNFRPVDIAPLLPAQTTPIRLSSLLTIPAIILLLFIQMVVSPTIKLANGHADLVLVFIVAGFRSGASRSGCGPLLGYH